MKFAAFRATAERVYGEIPERFKTGIDGLIVSRDAVPSPDLPDVYTLGECLTESWKIFVIDLILKIFCTGGYQHPVSTQDRRDQICKRLARPCSSFGK